MTSDRLDTREQLLNAAECLFAKHGYAAIGVREIVEAAGANIAAVNYHFGSKRELYLEVVRRAMRQGQDESPWRELEAAPTSRADAAAAVVRFIHRFLTHILQETERRSACSLFMREAAEPSEAIDAVVNDFIRPNQEVLIRHLSVLAPDLREDAIGLHAQSLLGQILHFRYCRPFIDRLGVLSLDDPADITRLADHIARVALQGIGCTSAVIERALSASPPDRESADQKRHADAEPASPVKGAQRS